MMVNDTSRRAEGTLSIVLEDEKGVAVDRKLWRERIRICGPESGVDDLLPLLLHKLNQ
jgi:hypothetical protein